MDIQWRSAQQTDMRQTNWESSNSSRKFLTGVAAIGVALGLSREMNALQTPGDAQNPGPQRPPRSGEPDPGPNFPNLPSPEKRMLEQNEKEIRKKVEQLYAAFRSAKEQAGEKTDSLTIEAFQQFVRQKTDQLKQQKNAHEVEYIVTLEGKHARLVARMKS